MNKNSDKVLKRQLEHKISKLDKEIDIVQDRELPNLENKIFTNMRESYKLHKCAECYN